MGDATSTAHLETAPLGSKHNRAAFSSNEPEFDRYLQTQAGQDSKRHVASTFVLCYQKQSTIIGYYTLSAAGVNVGDIPEDIVKKLPRYPQIPAALIGRLAVDKAYSGQGYGKFLLIDALRRTWEQSAQVAVAMVMVDALDDSAAQFYEHFGFQKFPEMHNKLFIPMKTVAKLFK